VGYRCAFDESMLEKYHGLENTGMKGMERNSSIYLRIGWSSVKILLDLGANYSVGGNPVTLSIHNCSG
jgi:hypothetical protein